MRAIRSAARRALVLVGAVFVVLVMVLLPGPTSPASAAVIVAPDAPNPINILPSTVKGATTGMTLPASQQALTLMLYRYSKSPEFWQAVQRVNTGAVAVRPGDIQIIQTATDDFKVPATKWGSVLKVAGGVGTALFGLEVGTFVGNGTLELFGFDVDGIVCGQTGTDLMGQLGRYFSAAECPDLYQGTPANEDVSGGLIAVELCGLNGNPGRCVKLIGQGPDWNPGTGGIRSLYCLAFKGGAFQPFAYTSDNPDGLGWAINATGSRYTLCANNLTLPSGWSDMRGATVSDQGTLFALALDGASEPVDVIGVGDPDRTIHCTVEASNGQTYTAASPSYRESEGVVPEPECPSLPPEVYPERVTIDQRGGPAEYELYDEQMLPETQSFLDLYPECMDGTCMLDLRLGTQSCFQTPALCLDWFSDPNRDAIYSCFYGTHAVDLAECYVYAPSFQTDLQTGYAYGDPDTGLPLASPTPNTRDAITFGAPASDPEQQRECFPTGWGVLNPVEWVMKPVICALEWAFVPRQAVVLAQGQAMITSWQSTPPAQVGAFVGEITDTMPTLSGCEGPPLDFSVELGGRSLEYEGTPLSACEAPMSDLASLARIIGALAMYWAAVVAISRYLGATLTFPEFGKA